MIKSILKKKELVISALILIFALAILPFFGGFSVSADTATTPKEPTIEVSGSDLAESTVKITSTTTGATIWYTLDESDPSVTTSARTSVTNGTAVTLNLTDVGMIRAYAVSGSEVSTVASYVVNFDKLDWYEGAVGPIIKILGTVVPVLLTLAGTAGAIFIVVLGVNYSKAEDAGKREEAKKRLIGSIIGIVAMLALLIVAQLFVSNAARIIYWIKSF